MKKITKQLSCWIFITTLFLTTPLQSLAQGFDPDNRLQTLGLPDPEGGPEAVTINVIQWVLGLLGLVAVTMVIIAGFTWVTAGGNEERIMTAKKTLRAAIIGLIVILLAWALVTFVFSGVNQVTTTA